MLLSKIVRNVVHRGLAAGLFAAATLVACGGGGGGGGGGGSSASGVVYTGSTTQATVDSSNAAALAGGSFVVGDTGASTNVVGVVTEPASPSTGQRSVEVANALKAAVSKIDFGSSRSVAVGVVAQDTIADCTGASNASFSINVDENTGQFSGTLSFNSFCSEPGTTISGQTSFSGQIDPNTINTVPQFVSLQFGTTNLAITDGAGSFAIAGTIAFTFSSGSGTATLTENFDIRNGSGTVFRVEDLTITVNDLGSEVTEMISGRFFHPMHGFVVVSTPAMFHIPAGFDFPTSGSLKVTGVNSTAVLTAQSDGKTFTLDIDEDGDGMTDMSLVVNWADV